MNWRLIEDGAHSGAYNMAVDEALLNSHCAVDMRPVLRFYDWQPSCLSLGRFQKLPSYLRTDSGAETSTVSAPVDWVRRPTGGRGVWHQCAYEITYSAAFSLDILPSEQTSVTASYRWISRGLLAGLQMLGIGARLSEAHAGFNRATRDAKNRAATTYSTKAENCFLSAAQCDAIVDGRKLIGAAQCRKSFVERVGVLQHGSILLDLDCLQWQRALGEDSLEKDAIQNGAVTWRNRVTTLRELGFAGTRSDVMAALCAGMEQLCRARFDDDELTPSEIETTQQLEYTKYGTRAWNEDGRDEFALSHGGDFAIQGSEKL